MMDGGSDFFYGEGEEIINCELGHGSIKGRRTLTIE
jgi:hypothetical protein